jgi:formylglycine-generating enzyme required for sulfatase activity
MGAYDTRAFPAPISDVVEPARLPSRRNPGAHYWIPNQDEWFKAAYYDPTRPGSRHYWNYPVRVDEAPNNLAPPGDAHSVNYLADYFCVGMPFVVTEVGAFPAATSYFGTYDQGGNVWEWLESWRETSRPNGWRATEIVRTLRGGSATYSALGVHAANVDPGHPNHALAVYGGRLARRAPDIKMNGNSTR